MANAMRLMPVGLTCAAKDSLGPKPSRSAIDVAVEWSLGQEGKGESAPGMQRKMDRKEGRRSRGGRKPFMRESW